MTQSDFNPLQTDERTRKEYHPPQLECAGTLTNLTQGTGSQMDEEGICGAGDWPC